MTLLFMDSFDKYSDEDDLRFDGYDDSPIGGVHANYARFSGQGLYMQSTNFTKNFGVNKSTIYMGIAIRKANGAAPIYSSTKPLIQFFDESEVKQVRLHLTPAYAIIAYQGDGTLLGTSSDLVFNPTLWNFVEVKIVISATVGEVTVRINETQILNLTSKDTKNGSDYIRKIDVQPVNNIQLTRFDDFYIDDAQFHGDCQVLSFRPDSISSVNNDFTASAGNKDECVDEDQTNQDTDYISSNILNDKQTFGITTGALPTIKGIRVANHVRDDAAGVRKVTPLVRSNGVNYSGSESGEITAQYSWEGDYWETDPDDSNPWDQTKLEAAEFGLEITT